MVLFSCSESSSTTPSHGVSPDQCNRRDNLQTCVYYVRMEVDTYYTSIVCGDHRIDCVCIPVILLTGGHFSPFFLSGISRDISIEYSM